ncbi:MAG: T9SS type A sorting domain-containing protein [Bacteroidia bacterium]
MKRLILSAILIFTVSSLSLQAQSNLQITFNAGTSALAGEDTVYMWAGIGISGPGDHWGFTTGELFQPGTGLGFMKNLGQNIWGICLEPFAYFSQGTGGTVPNGSTIYNLDLLFHNPGGSIQVMNNPQSIPLYFNMTTNPPTSNWVLLTANFQSCTLGINEFQISNGVIANYPNPLSDQTNFIYTLKTGGDVQLKIFNTIGQVVRTLVNERQNPNTYSKVWVGDNDKGRILYNGLYYYTLSVNGKTIQTNKLVISR